MPTTALFTAADLTHAVREFVSDDDAALAERMAWGWLSPILGLEARPDEVTDQLFGWALELGAIYAENPTGLAAYQLGEERRQYSTARRNEILEEVARSVDGATSGAAAAGLPRGRFPKANGYPDPIRYRGSAAAPSGF